MSDARRAGHRGALITADACARLDPQVKYEMTEEVISCFAPDCFATERTGKGRRGGVGEGSDGSLPLRVIMQMGRNAAKDRGSAELRSGD